MRNPMGARALLAILVLGLLGLGAPGQERRRTLEAPPLEVRWDEGLEGAAERVVELYPGLLADAERKLDIDYPRRILVRLVRDHESFRETVSALGGAPPAEHVAAVAFPFGDLIVLKTRAWTGRPGDELPGILQHEIVHCVLGHFVRENPRAVIPTWLDEGIAQWVAEAPWRGDESVLLEALRRDELIPFDDLEHAFPGSEGASALAYAQSLGLVRFVSRWGTENEMARRNVAALLRLLARGHDVDTALETVTGVPRPRLVEAWKGEVRRLSWPGVRTFGTIAFAVFIATATGLAWATARIRRRRMLDRLGDEPEPDSDATDPAR